MKALKKLEKIKRDNFIENYAKDAAKSVAFKQNK